MKIRTVLMAGILCLSQQIGAQDDGSTQALMHALVVEFSKMSPYLVSDEAFASAKGKATVGESLNNLDARIKRSPPAAIKRNPGFRITYSLLADHVARTKQAMDEGEYAYARMRVMGIGNLCAGCHMQKPKISHFSAFEFVTEREQKASFENANFLYTIRRYDEAEKLLNILIRKYPEDGLAADQLNEAYRLKLGILARVNRDAAAGIASLSEDLKNEKLPADVRQNVKNWIDTLVQWKSEKVNPAKLKTPQLLELVAQKLPDSLNRRIAPSDPQLLSLLRYSGLLYDRLYAEPAGKNTQEILYYLARCERSLAPHYWYSVNEIYLKECITQYPKQKFTRKCFDAYKEGMQERYFGKGLPEGVQRSLEALEQYL